MEVQDLQELKEKIKSAKEAKARAEGAIQQIEEDLEKDYGLTIDEVPDRITELNDKIRSYESKIQKLFKEIEGFDWDGALEF